MWRSAVINSKTEYRYSMSRKKLMTALLAVCMPLAVSAQHHVPETSSLVDWEEACSLCEEGHYYAAGQLLSKYIKDCGSEGKSFDARYAKADESKNAR